MCTAENNFFRQFQVFKQKISSAIMGAEIMC